VGAFKLDQIAYWRTKYAGNLYFQISIPKTLYGDNFYVAPIKALPVFFAIVRRMLADHFSITETDLNRLEIVRLDIFCNYLTSYSITNIKKILKSNKDARVFGKIYMNECFPDHQQTFKDGFYLAPLSKIKWENRTPPAREYRIYNKLAEKEAHKTTLTPSYNYLKELKNKKVMRFEVSVSDKKRIAKIVGAKDSSVTEFLDGVGKLKEIGCKDLQKVIELVFDTA
jgi:hypothetical protein